MLMYLYDYSNPNKKAAKRAYKFYMSAKYQNKYWPVMWNVELYGEAHP